MHMCYFIFHNKPTFIYISNIITLKSTSSITIIIIIMVLIVGCFEFTYQVHYSFDEPPPSLPKFM